MTARKLSIGAFLASIIWIAIFYRCDYLSSGRESQSSRTAAAGMIFLLLPFFFGLIIIILGLLVRASILFCKRNNFAEQKPSLVINVLLNLFSLAILGMPHFLYFHSVIGFNGKFKSVEKFDEEMKASWDPNKFQLAPNYGYDDRDWKEMLQFKQPWPFEFAEADTSIGTNHPAFLFKDGIHYPRLFEFELRVKEDSSQQPVTLSNLEDSARAMAENYSGGSSNISVLEASPENGEGSLVIVSNGGTSSEVRGLVNVGGYDFTIQGYYNAQGTTNLDDFVRVLQSLNIKWR